MASSLESWNTLKAYIDPITFFGNDEFYLLSFFAWQKWENGGWQQGATLPTPFLCVSVCVIVCLFIIASTHMLPMY